LTKESTITGYLALRPGDFKKYFKRMLNIIFIARRDFIDEMTNE
jgi:hypothetical protein